MKEPLLIKEIRHSNNVGFVIPHFIPSQIFIHFHGFAAQPDLALQSFITHI